MAVREYYDDYRPGCLSQFDLILACGDLKRPYLEFLVTMARCPLLYVRGNHDDDFALEPPEGCICIEDRIYVHQGIRILGLGGSYRYRKGNNMFTEAQMGLRILRQKPKLWRSGGIDILVTHAPARHINDFETADLNALYGCWISTVPNTLSTATSTKITVPASRSVPSITAPQSSTPADGMFLSIDPAG